MNPDCVVSTFVLMGSNDGTAAPPPEVCADPLPELLDPPCVLVGEPKEFAPPCVELAEPVGLPNEVALPLPEVPAEDPV